MSDIELQKEQLAAIRNERALLLKQIEQSQQTIERSHDLIRRIDDLLAKSGHEPPPDA